MSMLKKQQAASGAAGTGTLRRRWSCERRITKRRGKGNNERHFGPRLTKLSRPTSGLSSVFRATLSTGCTEAPRLRKFCVHVLSKYYCMSLRTSKTKTWPRSSWIHHFDGKICDSFIIPWVIQYGRGDLFRSTEMDVHRLELWTAKNEGFQTGFSLVYTIFMDKNNTS